MACHKWKKEWSFGLVYSTFLFFFFPKPQVAKFHMKFALINFSHLKFVCYQYNCEFSNYILRHPNRSSEMGSLALATAVLNPPMPRKYCPQKEQISNSKWQSPLEQKWNSPSCSPNCIYKPCYFIFGLAYKILQHSVSTKTPSPQLGSCDREAHPN